jgi:hypothetical protein
MERNLSELTLTSFNSIEFTAVNNLISMVTLEHTQSKPTVQQVSHNYYEPQ